MQEVRQSKRAFPEGKALFAYFLLIIVVQEHGLDDHHLVVFLLLDLHIGIERLEVALEYLKRFLHALGTAFAQNADHAREHDGMGIARRQGEILGQDIFEVGL